MPETAIPVASVVAQLHAAYGTDFLHDLYRCAGRQLILEGHGGPELAPLLEAMLGDTPGGVALLEARRERLLAAADTDRDLDFYAGHDAGWSAGDLDAGWDHGDDGPGDEEGGGEDAEDLLEQIIPRVRPKHSRYAGETGWYNTDTGRFMPRGWSPKNRPGSSRFGKAARGVGNEMPAGGPGAAGAGGADEVAAGHVGHGLAAAKVDNSRADRPNTPPATLPQRLTQAVVAGVRLYNRALGLYDRANARVTDLTLHVTAEMETYRDAAREAAEAVLADKPIRRKTAKVLGVGGMAAGAAYRVVTMAKSAMATGQASAPGGRASGGAARGGTVAGDDVAADPATVAAGTAAQVAPPGLIASLIVAGAIDLGRFARRGLGMEVKDHVSLYTNFRTALANRRAVAAERQLNDDPSTAREEYFTEAFDPAGGDVDVDFHALMGSLADAAEELGEDKAGELVIATLAAIDAGHGPEDAVAAAAELLAEGGGEGGGEGDDIGEGAGLYESVLREDAGDWTRRQGERGGTYWVHRDDPSGKNKVYGEQNPGGADASAESGAAQSDLAADAARAGRAEARAKSRASRRPRGEDPNEMRDAHKHHPLYNLMRTSTLGLRKALSYAADTADMIVDEVLERRDLHPWKADAVRSAGRMALAVASAVMKTDWVAVVGSLAHGRFSTGQRRPPGAFDERPISWLADHMRHKVPLGAIAYLTWSTMRAPVETFKAARDVIRERYGGRNWAEMKARRLRQGKPVSEAVEGEDGGRDDFDEESKEQARDAAEILAEGLDGLGKRQTDWVMALFYAALDAGAMPDEAAEAATDSVDALPPDEGGGGEEGGDLQESWKPVKTLGDGRTRWKGEGEHAGQYRTQKSEPGSRGKKAAGGPPAGGKSAEKESPPLPAGFGQFVSETDHAPFAPFRRPLQSKVSVSAVKGEGRVERKGEQVGAFVVARNDHGGVSVIHPQSGLAAWVGARREPPERARAIALALTNAAGGESAWDWDDHKDAAAQQALKVAGSLVHGARRRNDWSGVFAAIPGYADALRRGGKLGATTRSGPQE